MNFIHPTAIVSCSAKLGQNCHIGPYCLVGDKVQLGDNNTLISHVVIEGNTTVGSNNQFFPFSSIGHRPQDLKFKGEDSQLIIGDNNLIREYVTLQPGTQGGGMITKIGNQNLFMANSHLGHDSQVGNENVIANSVAIAGHVTIYNRVTIGGICGIHQYVRLADYCMIAAGSMVTLDVPVGCIGQGYRVRLNGINTIGLKRAGFNREDISELKKAYRNLFLTPGVFKEKLNAYANIDNHQLVNNLISFCNSTQRGIAPVVSKTNPEHDC